MKFYLFVSSFILIIINATKPHSVNHFEHALTFHQYIHDRFFFIFGFTSFGLSTELVNQSEEVMPVDREHAMKAVELLAKNKNIQLCVEESFKGALIAGAGAFAGGVIAGPIGMAAGAALGGITGAKVCKKYKPAYQVYLEMNEEEKQKLFEHVLKVIQQLKIEDGAVLIALASNTTASGHDQLQKQVLSYFGCVEPAVST